MNTRYQVLAAALLVALPAVARAQAGPTPEQKQAIEQRRQQMEEHRQQVLEQRQELLKQRRDEMQQHREEMKLQRDQVLAQRHDLMEQFRDLQKQLRDEVKSGQLTKDQAKDQLRAWREAHKPVLPDGAKPPHPGSGAGA